MEKKEVGEVENTRLGKEKWRRKMGTNRLSNGLWGFL